MEQPQQCSLTVSIQKREQNLQGILILLLRSFFYRAPWTLFTLLVFMNRLFLLLFCLFTIIFLLWEYYRNQVRQLGKYLSISFFWSCFKWFFSGIGDSCGFDNFPSFGLTLFKNTYDSSTSGFLLIWIQFRLCLDKQLD